MLPASAEFCGGTAGARVAALLAVRDFCCLKALCIVRYATAVVRAEASRQDDAARADVDLRAVGPDKIRASHGRAPLPCGH